MRRLLTVIIGWTCVLGIHANEFPQVVETAQQGYFPLASATSASISSTPASPSSGGATYFCHR